MAWDTPVWAGRVVTYDRVPNSCNSLFVNYEQIEVTRTRHTPVCSIVWGKIRLGLSHISHLSQALKTHNILALFAYIHRQLIQEFCIYIIPFKYHPNHYSISQPKHTKSMYQGHHNLHKFQIHKLIFYHILRTTKLANSTFQNQAITWTLYTSYDLPIKHII